MKLKRVTLGTSAKGKFKLWAVFYTKEEGGLLHLERLYSTEAEALWGAERLMVKKGAQGVFVLKETHHAYNTLIKEKV